MTLNIMNNYKIFSVISIGQTLSYGISLLRNITVARLLGPENFGIASTFLLMISSLEMLSNFSVEKLIVQSKSGNIPSFQATTQSVQLYRGAFLSLLLFLLSGPASMFFHNENALWAYRIIAVSPMIRAFLHLDIKRYHRNSRFLADIVTEFSSQVVTTIVAVLLCLYFKNYSAMVWAIITQSCILTLVSHIYSSRRFRVALHKKYIVEIMRFGWPLMFNGFLLFLIFQGDRAAVGRFYDMAVLGSYAVAATITLAPQVLLSRIVTTALLPKLSRLQGKRERHIQTSIICFWCMFLIAIFSILFWFSVGGKMISLLYGEEYLLAVKLVPWLGLVQSLILIRLVPTLIALSYGDSLGPMFANVPRALTLVVIIWVASLKYPPVYIAYVAILGEFLSLLTAFYLNKNRHGFNYLFYFNKLFVFR